MIKHFRLPSNIIERNEYISRVKPFMEKPLAKVFTGQRRVGKSFMLFQIIRLILSKNQDANIIYINKEDLAFDKIRTAVNLNDYILSNSYTNKKNYIFIDEIQEITDFEKAIRSLLLNENNDIYITGSNAKLLSGELATHLAGRTVEINVYSLSYTEFLKFHHLSDSKGNLYKYFKYGGLPYLINMKLKDEVVFEYLKNIYSTIVFRDVIARYKLRNINFLERLILFLADNIGSLFSAKKISDFLKSQQINLSHNQVLAYTDYLANAFLIHKVKRFDLKGKRFFETGEKYYFENTGLRNAIIGYHPGDDAKILENVIYNQLLLNGYKIQTGQLETREIDFVATKDNETIYVQVALQLNSEKIIDREFGNLLKIDDNYLKLVITLEDESMNTFKGIPVIPARKFLTEKFQSF